jgi:hypothetical protein
MNRTDRFWGATLVDGKVVPEVREVHNDKALLSDLLYDRAVPRFVWFRVMTLSEDGDDQCDDCDDGIPCDASSMCETCKVRAVRNWHRHMPTVPRE